MNDALGNIRTRNTVTRQREQVLGRDDQVQNNDGGYVFEVAGEDRIKRFLTLGTDGGTFYQKEQPYTRENAVVVIDFAKNHGVRLAYLLLDISEAGRAPRQNPTLFALAAIFAFGDEEAKISAKEVFNRIVRTASHLFTFVKYTEQLRGWGRSVKNAVAGWYLAQENRDLSYQLIKYRQREDWTHRDILRSVHPKPRDDAQDALFGWATGKPKGSNAGGWVKPFEAAQQIGRDQVQPFSAVQQPGRRYASLITGNPGLPWEALPDAALTCPETWEALIDAGMPITALIRQLPRLTKLGLSSSGAVQAKIIATLTSEDLLRKGRVHPVRLLYALKTYSLGHSIKGDSTWTPTQKVVDALDAAFYASFGTVEPTGKRTMLALDLSLSMTWAVSMCGVLQAREGACAMAMATAAAEDNCMITGFSASSTAADYSNLNYSRHGHRYKVGIEEVKISPRRRLDDNLATIDASEAGGTDCALPMLYARDRKLEIDTFVVYTDNETNVGTVHPFEAMRQYRQSSGIDAKLIVVGMSATDFTIADPTDKGMLDVAGFDASTPQIISGFSRGDFS